MLNHFQFKPHYFSIDNILASQERVPCKFNKKVVNMGHLDPSSETNDMEQGTSLELPYWIVKTLSNREVNVVDVEAPKVFKENYSQLFYTNWNSKSCGVLVLWKNKEDFLNLKIMGTMHACRDILRADANVVDLHKMSKFFYQFGKLLTYIENWNGGDIHNMLVETWRQRFRQLMDWAQHLSSGQPAADDTLDSLERVALARGRAAAAALNSWLASGAACISAADLVVGHRKRKLTQMDLR